VFLFYLLVGKREKKLDVRRAKIRGTNRGNRWGGDGGGGGEWLLAQGMDVYPIGSSLLPLSGRELRGSSFVRAFRAFRAFRASVSPSECEIDRV
jgi:hypothetical protein